MFKCFYMIYIYSACWNVVCILYSFCTVELIHNNIDNKLTWSARKCLYLVQQQLYVLPGANQKVLHLSYHAVFESGSTTVWHLNLDWWCQCTVESPDYLAKTESHENHASREASHTPGCLWWNNHQTGPKYYFRAHPRPPWEPAFSSLKQTLQSPPVQAAPALTTPFVPPVHQSSKWQVGLSLTSVFTSELYCTTTLHDDFMLMRLLWSSRTYYVHHCDDYRSVVRWALCACTVGIVCVCVHVYGWVVFLFLFPGSFWPSFRACSLSTMRGTSLHMSLSPTSSSFSSTCRM